MPRPPPTDRLRPKNPAKNLFFRLRFAVRADYTLRRSDWHGAMSGAVPRAAGGNAVKENAVNGYVYFSDFMLLK